MTGIAESGDPSQETASDTLWTPEQASLIQFTGNVVHSVGFNLTRWGLPRLSSVNGSPNWPARRDEFIDRAQRSGGMIIDLAEAESDEVAQEVLGLAGQILHGIADHTREFGRPRLNLRKLGIHDTDRREFGAKLLNTHKIVSHLLGAGSSE